MTDDLDGLPIRDYIARGATEGALAAAQQLTEVIGVSLREVLTFLQEAIPQATPQHRTGHSSISVSAGLASAAGSAPAPSAIGGTAVAKSATHADLGELAAEEFRVVRYAEVEELGKSRFDLSAVSLRTKLFAAIVLLAAVYPFLGPDVQKYLLDEVNLSAALAQIFSLLKF